MVLQEVNLNAHKIMGSFVLNVYKNMHHHQHNVVIILSKLEKHIILRISGRTETPSISLGFEK